MNARTRYLLSMICLALFVAITTAFVQHKRLDRLHAQQIEAELGLTANDVKNPDQMRQIIAIQQQMDRGQSASAKQVAQLVAIVNGQPDMILQDSALATLMDITQSNTLSSQQKKEVASATLTSLKSPERVVRGTSVMLLGRLGDQSAVPSLLPLLNDPEEGVRSSTKKALERLQKSTPAPGH